MNKTPCKSCDGTGICKDPGYDGTGCPGCGGLGYCLFKKECPKCKRNGLFTPGTMTRYEGKKYYSVDGLAMVCHINGPDVCVRYDENERKGVEG